MHSFTNHTPSLKNINGLLKSAQTETLTGLSHLNSRSIGIKTVVLFKTIQKVDVAAKNNKSLVRGLYKKILNDFTCDQRHRLIFVIIIFCEP